MRIGKVSENVLKRSVLKQIHTKRKEVLSGAGVGADCAIFSFSKDENAAVCMQEAPVAAMGEMGHLIQKCANNLAAKGAEPVAVTITLLLPETTEEPALKALMAEAEEICRKLNLEIAGGQTRITKAVTMPVAVVAGYGKIPGAWGNPRGEGKLSDGCGKAVAQSCGVSKARPGQDVVISKWIGLQGTALIAKKHKEKLLTRYPAYLVEEAAGFDKYLSIIPEAATAVKSGVCAMHDASEGGIFGALWELAEGAGVGLTIDMKKLPLRQETVEVCECCNVNPYELLSGGCLIMTTSDGPGLVAALEAENIPAVIVGKVTDSRDRILVNEDEVRYMDKPKQDEIYRFQA